MKTVSLLLLFIVQIFCLQGHANSHNRPDTLESDEKKEITNADFVLQHAATKTKVEANGTSKTENTYEFKSQNEKGRIELGLRDVHFLPGISKIKFIEAYSINQGSKELSDLSKVQDRSESNDKYGLSDQHRLIVPINNVKADSVVGIKFEENIESPLIPGVATFDFGYGAEFPEMSGHVEISSVKPVHASAFDTNHYLKVSEYKKDDLYFVDIDLVKPSFKVPFISHMGFIPNGFIPMVIVSTAQSWGQIAEPLTAKYDAIVNEALPPQFKKIAEDSKKISDEIERINFVTVEVSKLVAYSGNWITQERMYFPRSHAEVVAEKKGDCKDYASSVTAILRNTGIDAAVALVNSASQSQRTFRDYDLKTLVPTPTIFNHAIVNVKLKNGRVLWVDSTRSTPYAAGIGPEIAGSPSLVLRKGVNEVVKIPEDPIPAKALLTRNVEIDQAEHESWKGNVHLEGAPALSLVQEVKVYGNAAIDRTLPYILIGNASEERSKATLPKEALEIHNTESNWPFEILGSNPVREIERDHKKSKQLTIDLSLRSMRVASGEEGAYIGPVGTYETKTVYKNAKVQDEADLDCYVLSPWATLERTVENGSQNNVIVTETLTVKKPVISREEGLTENYESFAGKIGDCVARRSTPLFGEANLNEKVTATDESFPDVHKLAISPDSEKIAEEMSIMNTETDGAYVERKLKRIFDATIKANPKNDRARAYRTTVIMSMGFMVGKEYLPGYKEEVREQIDQLLKDMPNSAVGHRFRGRIYFNANDYDRALADYSMAYREDANDMFTRLGMAKVYRAKGNAAVASQWSSAAASIAKTRTEKTYIILDNLESAENRKDFDAQVKAHQDLIAMNPKSPWRLHNLGCLYLEMKEWDKGIEYERKALTIMDFGAARSNLADLLNGKGRSMLPSKKDWNAYVKSSSDRKIENIFLESYKNDPTNLVTLWNLVEIYKLRTQFEHETDWLDKADIYLAEGLKRAPNDIYLKSQEKQILEMKKQLMAYFQQRHIKPSGRWPAEFESNERRKPASVPN